MIYYIHKIWKKIIRQELKRTQENSLINNISIGKFINVGNYLTMPEDKTNIKINNVPLPTIEIKKNCTANFINKEYCIKLENKFDISTNYMISLNIILKKRLGNYEINDNNFIDNISLYLTIIHNNGLIGKYIVENATII